MVLLLAILLHDTFPVDALVEIKQNIAITQVYTVAALSCRLLQTRSVFLKYDT